MDSLAQLIASLQCQETADVAVDRLCDMGAAAIEPLLAAILNDNEENRVREICAQIVGHIVPDGVNRLLSLLRTAQNNNADLVAWGLRYHHGAAIAEPELFSLLNDASPTIRANAARALRYIHVDLRICDMRLVAALKDRHSAVRLDALRTLIELADVGLDHYGVSDLSPILAAARDGMLSDNVEERQLSKTLLDRMSTSIQSK